MLQLENVRSTYGSVRALEDFSLQVARGEFVCILGPSGCGKSTLLNAIAGFVEPDHGRIFIDGIPTDDLPPSRRATAMVFQSHALFPHLSVFENVAFGLRVRKLPKESIRRKVNQTLELVKLTDLNTRFPKQLSGGQQQRVALARALVIEPKVLLLDEPFSSLDAKLREQMRIELKELQRQTSVTALFVTHDQEEAFDLGDRIVLMNNGRVEQIGTAADLYEEPQTLFAANFIGRANILSGKIVRRLENIAVVSVANLEIRISVDTGNVGDPIHLLLRPEQISIGTRSLQNSNSFNGILRMATHLGSAIRYIVDVAGITLVAAAPAVRTDLPSVGQHVQVTFGTAIRVIPPAKASQQPPLAGLTRVT